MVTRIGHGPTSLPNKTMPAVSPGSGGLQTVACGRGLLSACHERDQGCVRQMCADCCKQRTSDCNWHRDDRWFGTYRCECEHTWSSGFAYRGLTQQCRRCNAACYPAHVRSHDHSKTDNRVPHDSARCERCRRFGACRAATQSVDDYEWDGYYGYGDGDDIDQSEFDEYFNEPYD